nr:MAG TPA: hypothetical protein [Caudoviricetes sp.]
MRRTRRTLKKTHCKEDIMEETMSNVIQFFFDRMKAVLEKK